MHPSLEISPCTVQACILTLKSSGSMYVSTCVLADRALSSISRWASRAAWLSCCCFCSSALCIKKGQTENIEVQFTQRFPLLTKPLNLPEKLLPLPFVCSPAPALLSAHPASAPAGWTPTVQGSPCQSESGVVPSERCRDPEHLHDAARASHHLFGLAPTVGLVDAPHVRDAPSPQ